MKRPNQEYVRLWNPPGHSGVALMHATYVGQTFSKHTHDDYALGVIEQGGLGFRYRGENLVAVPGQICLVIPGETHDGHAAVDNGWTYRMFYLQPALMRRAVSHLSGKSAELPFFKPGVLQDKALSALILQTHQQFDGSSTGLMEKETSLIRMLSLFISRHADPAPLSQKIGNEHKAVVRAKDFIETYYDQDLSVISLAKQACLSPYHFIRVFKARTGLSPHTFLMQVRVRCAKERISKGESIAQAAAAVGFSDQSHLTRHFKRTLGVTPGQYRNSVQD